MSTYYFLVCRDHGEITDAASRTAGGYCPLVDSNKTLIPYFVSPVGGAPSLVEFTEFVIK